MTLRAVVLVHFGRVNTLRWNAGGNSMDGAVHPPVTPASPHAKNVFRRYSRKSLVAICAVCTAVVIGLQMLPFEKLRTLRNAEFFVQDTLLRLGKAAPRSPELVFLAIDQASLRLDHIEQEEIDASPALKLD